MGVGLKVGDGRSLHAEQVEAMTDEQLVDAWDKVEDGENLSEFEQAVIDEIERRNIDL